MPNQINAEQFRTKMNDLLTREQQRSEEAVEDKTRLFAQRSEQEEQADIDLIDRLIYDGEVVDVMNLTIEEREQLKAIKSRTQARMLVNMTKNSGGSEEMLDVQENLIKLENILNDMQGQPATKEALDEIEMRFELLIAACSYYVDHKDPAFSKGKKRKKLVEDILSDIHYEVDCLRIVRSTAAEGELEQKTIGSLLHLSDVSGAKSHDERVAPAKKAYLSKDGAKSVAILKMQTPPSAKIKKLSDAKRPESIHSFIDIMDTLKTIKPGSVRAVNFEMDGRKVRLVQQVDNSLYLVENSFRYPLQLTVGMIVDRLEADIVENEDLYGSDYATQIINDLVVDDSATMGDIQKARKLCTAFIGGRISLEKNVLDNIPTKLLKNIAGAIAEGMMQAEDVKRLAKAMNEKGFINNAENLELVRMQTLHANGKIDQIVTIRPKEVEAPPAGEETWTEEEKKIKDIIADIIYPGDTWTQDEMINQPPGERVRLVLKKNSLFIAKMFVDTYINTTEKTVL